MPKVYPPASDGPLVVPSGASGQMPFLAPMQLGSRPTGEDVATVNFVVFAWPAPDNGRHAPSMPSVALINSDPLTAQTTTATLLTPGGKFASIPIAAGDGQPSPVAATFEAHPSGQAGVYRVEIWFRPDGYAGPFTLKGSQWILAVTNTAAIPIGITAVVDGADSVKPWMHFPQDAFDAGQVLAGLPGGPRTLVTGKSYRVDVPICNYGTAPLTVAAEADQVEGAFTLHRAALSIPPGSCSPAGAGLTLDLLSDVEGTMAGSFLVGDGGVGDSDADTFRVTATFSDPEPAFAAPRAQLYPIFGTIGSRVRIQGVNLSGFRSAIFNAAVPVLAPLEPGTDPSTEQWAVVPPGLTGGAVTLTLTQEEPATSTQTASKVLSPTQPASLTSQDTFTVVPADPAPSRPVITIVSRQQGDRRLGLEGDFGNAANTAVTFSLTEPEGLPFWIPPVVCSVEYALPYAIFVQWPSPFLESDGLTWKLVVTVDVVSSQPWGGGQDEAPPPA